MKKTITAAAALAASSSAFGLIGPVQESKTICLNTFVDENRLLYAGKCDEARNNIILDKPILKNGCAQGQVALTAIKLNGQWNPQIQYCLRPNVVQL